MPSREFYHRMVVVDDLDAAEAHLGALFPPVTYMPKHWSDKRWASLARVGSDFVVT